MNLYFYEGRTIRGIGLMAWALVVALGAVVASALTLVAVALMLEPGIQSPSGLVPAALTALAAVCGIDIGQVFMAALFVIGFHHAYAGRYEYGLAHARSLERALVFLIVFALFTALAYIYSVTNSVLQPGFVGVPALDLLSGNVLLAPLGALFAGLTLLFTGRGLADAVQSRRLRTALVLGVVGAVAGPLLLLLGVGSNVTDLRVLVSGLLASAVAGQGISALSLLVFVLVYREVRRNLEAGNPAPVLPRIQHVYRWMYPPAYVPMQPPWSGPPPPPKP